MLHHLPVLEAAPVLVPLEDVVPLSSLLVPVAVAKQRIARVREAVYFLCMCVCVRCQAAVPLFSAAALPVLARLPRPQHV
jgi:hypothetical protein